MPPIAHIASHRLLHRTQHQFGFDQLRILRPNRQLRYSGGSNVRQSLFEHPASPSAKRSAPLFGLAGFIYLTVYPVGDDSLLRWGILLWYTTLGAIIGVFGVYTWNPVLKLPMPWWFLAPLLGAWMNFVLTFFAYDTLAAAMASMFGPEGILSSPFWFVAEGAICRARHRLRRHTVRWRGTRDRCPDRGRPVNRGLLAPLCQGNALVT